MLETIENNMRLEAIKTGKDPKNVRLAKGFEARQAAWKNEAARFYYAIQMVTRKQK